MHLQVATSGEAVGGSRYRTLGRLGSGGMADVDLALQTGVGGSSRLCVLKRVRKDLAGRAEFVSMFFEEARISASLSHPNIVQIYEVGGDEQDCFLAMEFLRGHSYAHVVRASKFELSDYRVDLEVLIATLNGLEHAHQRRDLSGKPMGLVHRDISPPNVIVTYEGEIKLLDFGVAKIKDSVIQTEAGILKGKVAYMAPEMVSGDALDARADIYAVGVMLWEATAGRDRWPRMNDMAILAQLTRGGPVESPGAAERGLPPLADEIALKALAEDPNDRYQTAAELRDALLELCERLGGRLSQSEIAAHMAERFGADREREGLEIEQALKSQHITPGRGTDAEVGGFTKRVRRTSERPAPDSHPGVDSQRTPQARGRMWALLAAVALAGAIVAKLLAPTSGGGAAKGGDAAESSATTLEPPNSAAPVAAPAEPAPASSVPERKPKSAPRAGKAGKPERAATPGAAQPGSRGLSLDRQDPWKE
ncbi:MAG TPA: serine/threonine-protein kinase [Polyangiaceae bacterium]|nr:serine/threonine-protein kinase [Polyangiaceae bacterium]